MLENRIVDLEDKIKQIDKDYDNVKITYSDENLGCSKAFNNLIIESNTDWVLITQDDMLFDSDWLDVLNNILEEKPHLEQIHLNSFNCMVFHKKTIARMGWWDERYRYFPDMCDDDWYLRTVEALGYSPYVNVPGHVTNLPESYAEFYDSICTKELFNSDSNFTYFCNSKFSNNKIIGLSTITGNVDDAGTRNNSDGSMDKGFGESGAEFHMRKWKIAQYSEDSLVCKDTTSYIRQLHDVDWYPEVRAEYVLKYFGENVYKELYDESR